MSDTKDYAAELAALIEAKADPEEIGAAKAALERETRLPPEAVPASEYRTAQVDPHDLEAIAGIGTVTATMLRDNGITTLRMLGRVSAARAAELGIKDEWIEQAKALSELA